MTVLRSGSASDVGLVRSSNQDLALEAGTLFAVADGMGGHAGGEVASRLAIDALKAAFGRHPTVAGLAGAVESANEAVWEHGVANSDLRGMGTTLTAVALVAESGRDVLALVNVGDSRSYRYHDGELVQITRDHSLAEEMVLRGELTPAEAAVHPHRHILTRALGVSPDVDVDVWEIVPTRGDRFLLCSDGLTNELGDGQIGEVLSHIGGPQEAADTLVQAARIHGGSDNITVVVVDVVVGEEHDGSTPLVSAVATTGGAGSSVLADGGPEGQRPSSGQSEGPSGTPDGRMRPRAVPEASEPGRRERNRARRRARRRARGRRLVTFRTLLFVVVLAGIVVGTLSALRWYDTNSYFVGLDGNELVIYQGRVGGLLWYHPVEVERTGVTTGDVTQDYLKDLQSGVQTASLVAARTYVENLVAAHASITTPTATVPTTTTSPTTTSSTTTSSAPAGGGT